MNDVGEAQRSFSSFLLSVDFPVLLRGAAAAIGDRPAIVQLHDAGVVANSVIRSPTPKYLFIYLLTSLFSLLCCRCSTV